MACTNCGGSGHNASTCTRARRERSDAGIPRGSYKEKHHQEGHAAGYKEGIQSQLVKIITFSTILSGAFGFVEYFNSYGELLGLGFTVALISALSLGLVFGLFIGIKIFWRS